MSTHAKRTCATHFSITADYVDVVAKGTNSVFTLDNVKSLGTIRDLYNASSVPFPVNGTVYLGIDDEDVMYWLGENADAPFNDKKEIEIIDSSTDAYVNVCADVDRNGVCDHEDTNRKLCENYGSYYLKQGHAGKCCGADIAYIQSQTDLPNVITCAYDADVQAFCGKTSDGRWVWAPEDDKGTVYDLLGCPGYSFVSDYVPSRGEIMQFGCKGTIDPSVSESTPPSSSVSILTFSGQNLATYGIGNTGDFISFSTLSNKAMSISGTLGTHEYICTSTGEIFECKGDNAPYSQDSNYVADTGFSTNELLGSGGCPPGIKAYWTFDNSSAADSIGKYNGSITGASPATGKVSGALSFTGLNYVSVPNMTLSGDKFSVEAWIYPEVEDTTTRYIFNQGSVKLYLKDSQLYGYLDTVDIGPVDLIGGLSLFEDSWYHVAFLYDGDIATIYANGFAATEGAPHGNIAPSTNAFTIGGAFKGVIDEIAVYDSVLRNPTIYKHYNSANNYCAGTAGLAQNHYCASDGDWTTNLDSKDESSCEKAGFTWTGTLCCSEDDDPAEYYNDKDIDRADLRLQPSGQTIAAHSGAEVRQDRIELRQEGQYATIQGPARLSVQDYYADTLTGTIGPLCGKVPNSLPQIVPIPRNKNETIRVMLPGPSTDCPYYRKVITSTKILATGGCWNKTFIERGSLLTPKILNFEGEFIGCSLPAQDSVLSIMDYHKTSQNLLQNLMPTCSDIKRDAAGSDNHAVCGPGGVWLYTSDPNATYAKNITWNPGQFNVTILSDSGCCRDDQCWDGNNCTDSGSYYGIGNQTFVCRD